MDVHVQRKTLEPPQQQDYRDRQDSRQDHGHSDPQNPVWVRSLLDTTLGDGYQKKNNLCLNLLIKEDGR